MPIKTKEIPTKLVQGATNLKGAKSTGKGGSAGTGFRAPFEDPNTLVAIVTARVVELISEGPIEGIVGGVQTGTDVTTDSVPQAGQTEVAIPVAMPSASYEIQTSIQGYVPGSGPAEITQVYAQTTTTFKIQVFEEDMNPPESGVPDFGAPLIRTVDWSINDIGKSTFFNDTAVSNNDPETVLLGLFDTGTRLLTSRGSQNFKGVRITERKGTQDQQPLPGHPEIEAEVPVGQEATNDGASPVTPTRHISDPNIDAVRLKLMIPQLTSQNTSTGDLETHTVTVAWEVSTDGGAFVELPGARVTVNGKTLSPYITGIRLALPKPGAFWDVRLRRITPDEESAADVSNTIFSSITELIDTKINYSNSAVLGVEIDAQQFGSQIPARSYLMKGLKIRIPENYDPIARTYSPSTWNGVFKIAWTNNPAWVLYDILTNERYGLGRDIEPEGVDKFALFEIGKYCDGNVFDGQGGFGPRYTFNGVINSKAEAYAVVNTIASNMRSMVYWAQGQIVVTQDSPRTPDTLVSNSNTADGLFNYAGSALKDKHSVIKTSWTDPDDGYRPSIEYAEDQAMIRRFGIRELSVIAPGVTDRAQASRFGLYIIDNEKFSPQTVAYQASLAQSRIRPGEIIEISDTHVQGVRVSGSIASITAGTSIELDASVTLVTGQNYTLAAILPDGTRETRAVTSAVPGTYTTLTIASAYTTDPLVGAQWSLSSAAVAPTQWRVVGVTEDESNLFTIVGIKHDTNKYARVELQTLLPVDDFTIFPSGPLPQVDSITAAVFTISLTGGGTRIDTLVSWATSQDPRASFYEVAFKEPGGTIFQSLGVNSSLTRTLSDLTLGIYTVRVRILDGFGKTGPWREAQFIVAVDLPIADIENFSCIVTGPSTTLSWDTLTDPETDHYEIRFQGVQSGATWQSAFLIAEIDQPTGSPARTSVVVPTIRGTYLIKAVDIFGEKSVTETLCVQPLDPLEQFTTVDTLIEQPTFSGTKVDTIVRASKLELVGATVMDDWGTLDSVGIIGGVAGGTFAQNGTYFFNTRFDLGGIFTATISPNLVFTANVVELTMSAWNTLAEVGIIGGVALNQTNVELEIRTTQTDPTGSPTWTDWMPFVTGEFTFWGAEVSAILTTSDINFSPSVSTLEMAALMSDRTEIGALTTAADPAGPDVVTYGAEFFNIPDPVVTINDQVAGDLLSITSKLKSGFTVAVTNGGVRVARNLSWSSIGHGLKG